MEKKWHSGKVVHGNANGRKWHYPTINLTEIEPALDLENGVYAVALRLADNKTYQGMLYAGTRPTLQLKEKVLEIHLLDYQGDLYGQVVNFQIVKKVREEEKFNSVEALAQQLSEDEKHIRMILNAEI